MGLLTKDIEALSKFGGNRLDRVARKVLVDNQEVIIGILQAQLHDGKVGERPVVAPYYAESTKEFARENPPRAGAPEKTGPWNFDWFGFFFESMFLKVGQNEFNVEYDPETVRGLKSSKKWQKLGNVDIAGISKENQNEIITKIVEPELQKQILNEIDRIIKY